MKAAVLALTVLAVAGWAQSGNPPAPPITDLQTYLSLTDAQVQSLQNIQTQLRTSTASLRQQISQKEQGLRTALAAGSSSAATLGQFLLDIQGLQKQITQAQAGVQTQAAAVLTDAQKTKLQALSAAAQLQPQIREAEMVGLITPPQNSGVPGMGPMMGGRGAGVQGMGRGMGQGMGPMMGPRGRPP
ncbi:MAG: hypothetical protein LAQ30_13480 [Acidobacteriia bacterium]|nr:hypothetical protein [Terriglobia bacterium]